MIHRSVDVLVMHSMTMSVIVTVFIVPAAYLLVHRNEEQVAILMPTSEPE